MSLPAILPVRSGSAIWPMALLMLALLTVLSTSPLAHAGSSRSFELKGVAGYASATNRHLLVYASNEVGSGPNIYGRVLLANGAPVGDDFRISQLDGEMSKPVVSYSPTTDTFLVSWGRKLYDVGRAEIYGQLIGGDGTLIGGEFLISFSDVSDRRAAIAYCPGNDRFLVTWTRGLAYDFTDGTSDVYGQFVASNGTLVNGNFLIASGPLNQMKSSVACDAASGRLLVTWEDQRNADTHDDIYGQLIAPDGTMIGAMFPIFRSPNIERRPAVANNSADGTFLVVWESSGAGVSELFSQLVDTNGNLLGSPLSIGAELGTLNRRPAVAYLAQQDMFFTVFAGAGSASTGADIYGQFIKGNGKPRGAVIPMAVSRLEQNRPDVCAAENTFLAVWTDFRDTAAGPGSEQNLYEYYGRVISNDMRLSSRWRLPQSK